MAKVKKELLSSPFILIFYRGPISYDPSMIVVVGVREMIHLGSQGRKRRRKIHSSILYRVTTTTTSSQESSPSYIIGKGLAPIKSRPSYLSYPLQPYYYYIEIHEVIAVSFLPCSSSSWQPTKNEYPVCVCVPVAAVSHSSFDPYRCTLEERE